uniref:3-keto-steroid reductase n=1 Tax=Branchiostoma floridae TaxID=7739 RepID=C3XV15_BRAFL|eukprot:XP_002611932.1 hypothetical protein BRAFLDRAFT_106524 [Branchiostoma floridae]
MVAVITGGNAGIGLTLAERLLTLDPTLTLCLACRNMMKAEVARQALLTSHPGSRVECVRLDTSDVQSVYTAAQKIREEYHRVDHLYLNAGTMGKVSVDATAILKAMVSPRAPEIFRTGEKLLSQQDDTTKDGLQEIFATNVFGHFVLIRELEDVLCQPDHTSQVWLSRQVPSSLDPLCKYTSRCKVWGTAYVDREKLDIDLPTAEQFYQKLLQLENHFREKYREVRSKIRGQ